MLPDFILKLDAKQNFKCSVGKLKFSFYCIFWLNNVFVFRSIQNEVCCRQFNKASETRVKLPKKTQNEKGQSELCL